MKPSLLAFGLSSALLCPAPGHAQLADVQPGARIRVTAPTIAGSRVTAVILERQADTLHVSPAPGARLVIPIGSITKLSVSRGRRSWDGAKTGALWGAGLFAPFGVLLRPRSCRLETERSGGPFEAPTSEYVCRPIAPPAAVAVFAVSGAFWGAIIGGFVRREHWDTVNLSSQVALQPLVDGSRVGVTLRW